MGFVTEITFNPFNPTNPTDQVKFHRAWKQISSLADTISELIAAGNEKGLLAALDADGEGMTPVKRTGGGPPLIPHETSSRFIRNFKVRPQVLRNRLRFKCYWPRMPFARFHETGTKNMPRRNPSGIRPKDILLITRAIKAHFGGKVDFDINTDVRS